MTDLRYKLEITLSADEYFQLEHALKQDIEHRTKLVTELFGDAQGEEHSHLRLARKQITWLESVKNKLHSAWKEGKYETE